MTLLDLHAAIEAVCPIVSVCQTADNQYLVTYADDASDSQKAEAQRIISAFNPALTSPAELWLSAENYYTGADAPDASRLAKSETDAYSLGTMNYKRKQEGKDPAGDLVISPDNSYMLANLAWGQTIWAEYRTRLAQLKAGTAVSTDFSALGDKPYSFSQVIAHDMATT